ncbi:hypothetical protein ROZALSC1DRAFT_22600, partial [Rozella allomycis CSF55]
MHQTTHVQKTSTCHTRLEWRSIIQECDFKLPGVRDRVFLRPHTHTLLDFLFDNFKVGVWTSASHKNAMLLVNRVFGEKKSKLEFVMDRQFCRIVSQISNTIIDHVPPKSFVKPLACKDLETFWKNQTLNPADQFSEKNTVIIDDSTDKVCQNGINAHVIPEYDLSNASYNAQKDTVLLQLKSHLEKWILSDYCDNFDYVVPIENSEGCLVSAFETMVLTDLEPSVDPT